MFASKIERGQDLKELLKCVDVFVRKSNRTIHSSKKLEKWCQDNKDFNGMAEQKF